MSLTKGVKENKWGIILGGIWGIASWVNLCCLTIVRTPAIFFLLFELPAYIGVWTGTLFNKYLIRENPDTALAFILLSPFVGMIIGYATNKILRKVRE